jgi:membrane-associated protein
MSEFLDFLFHAEKHLEAFITQYHGWIYVLLFLIIFCETGLIVTPFLPGDSLLFAVGALAAKGWLELGWVSPLLIVAAILGDSVNYAIGHWMGPKVFHDTSSRLWNREYLLRAHRFYEKYGGRAIVLSRFVPIIRTFAPFVAGVGAMAYPKFLFYNVTGAVAWIAIFVGGGYAFGGLEIVQRHMKLVILGIIVISVLPIVWEFFRAYWENKKARHF